ncbi:MAG: hypothetical protein O7G85_15920 [Planctomycetota bacterium]|nr:hypothetical protein [Planctomycetota bacterium]
MSLILTIIKASVETFTTLVTKILFKTACKKVQEKIFSDEPTSRIPRNSCLADVRSALIENRKRLVDHVTRNQTNHIQIDETMCDVRSEFEHLLEPTLPGQPTRILISESIQRTEQEFHATKIGSLPDRAAACCIIDSLTYDFLISLVFKLHHEGSTPTCSKLLGLSGIVEKCQGGFDESVTNLIECAQSDSQPPRCSMARYVREELKREIGLDRHTARYITHAAISDTQDVLKKYVGLTSDVEIIRYRALMTFRIALLYRTLDTLDAQQPLQAA